MGLVVWVSGYVGMTYARNMVWRDDLSLWEDTVKKSPLKARVRLNLGTSYQSRGLLRKAEYQYREAVALGPPMASVYNNLAVMAVQEKEPEKGVEYFKKALEIEPGLVSVRENLEKVEGQLEERKRVK